MRNTKTQTIPFYCFSLKKLVGDWLEMPLPNKKRNGLSYLSQQLQS
jgi:hypothetical protein